jgi:hypothetical protein
LRLAEIVGLNVGDVFMPDGTPRVRLRVRQEIAKGGRVIDDQDFDHRPAREPATSCR